MNNPGQLHQHANTAHFSSLWFSQNLVATFCERTKSPNYLRNVFTPKLPRGAVWSGTLHLSIFYTRLIQFRVAGRLELSLGEAGRTLDRLVHHRATRRLTNMHNHADAVNNLSPRLCWIRLIVKLVQAEHDVGKSLLWEAHDASVSETWSDNRSRAFRTQRIVSASFFTAWSYFLMLMDWLPPPTVAAPTGKTLRCAERLVARATGFWQLLSSHLLRVK